MVKPARMRPDDFALATGKTSLIAASREIGEGRDGAPPREEPPDGLLGGEPPDGLLGGEPPDGEPRDGETRGGDPPGRERRDVAPVRLPAAAWPVTAAGDEGDPFAALPIRSAERRRWATDLTGPAQAGLVLHGVGGIGKSTLASQIISRVSHLEPERVTAVISGAVSVDTVLGGVAAALRRHPAVTQGGGQAQSVRAADRPDVPWAHRLALLRELVLGQVPLLLVLDDFDDNLSADSGNWTVREPALAELIASWASQSHRGKLLITCRHPFRPPATTGPPLGFRHVGPLSRSGAFELAKSLRALRRLGDHELERAWGLLGGHPQAMKYLDSLLGTGDIRFPEVARRLVLATRDKTDDPARPAAAAPTELAPAAAEAIALAAGDLLVGELFDHLSAGARTLLIRVLNGNGPLGDGVLRPPAGAGGPPPGPGPLVAECMAAGLLTADPSGDPSSVVVPRWTADQLRHRAGARRGGPGQRGGAARRAGDARRAGQAHRNADVNRAHRRPVRPWRSRRTAAGAVAGLLLATTAGVLVLVHPASSRAHAAAGPPPGAAAVLDQASAVRSRAAVWVAQQVSRDAIVACDPDMCAALLAERVAPGNLLELRVATPDPLGSDVLVATAAVRSQFGARLASVYAPAVLASFGSGRFRIDVRAVAPDGAAAYRAGLASDLTARRDAGRQLLGNPHIRVSAAARHDLYAGQVDARVLTTLAALAVGEPLQVDAFGDSGPGAGVGLPLRSAAITVTGRANPAAVRDMLSFVRAQRPPYVPARSLIEPGPGGAPVLSIEFAAPSPLGLLQAQPAH